MKFFFISNKRRNTFALNYYKVMVSSDTLISLINRIYSGQVSSDIHFLSVFKFLYARNTYYKSTVYRFDGASAERASSSWVHGIKAIE